MYRKRNTIYHTLALLGCLFISVMAGGGGGGGGTPLDGVCNKDSVCDTFCCHNEGQF